MDDALARAVRRYAALDDGEIARFRSALERRVYSAGERFGTDSFSGSRIAFVERGLFRFFYVDEYGAEATRAFVREGGFLASREAMFRGRPSSFIVEALEDSVLLTARGGVSAASAFANPAWIPFFVGLMEERLEAKDRRIEGFLMGDATARYLDFVSEFPDIERRAKQHHIASYLGISPVSLSRIRRRLPLRK